MSIRTTLLLLFPIVSLAGPPALAATPWVSGKDWELVFEDDFDGPSLNARNWSRIDYVNHNAPDWRKYQSQDESLVEFREQDGNSAMTLWGKYGDYTTQTNQTAPAQTYACRGVYSLKTFQFQYGYVEVRARFDCVQGVWPAIWMMPKSDSIGWPAGGEIDIMEHLNYEGRVYQTIHWSENGVPNQDKSQGVTPGWSDGAEKTNWHTYGMEWTEEGITFYVDGKETGSFKKPNNANWPFDKDGNEFYLIIDQQIGGNWVENAGVNKGIDQNTLANSGAAFDIDYVKVYSSSKYNHLVPEPATAALSLVGTAILLTRRKRSRL